MVNHLSFITFYSFLSSYSLFSSYYSPLSRYILATFLSVYNKYMFDPKHLGFHYPLFVTGMHQIVQFILASLCLLRFPRLRPRPWMTPREYGQRIVPCGVATGMDIGLSNSSLQTITLSFYTMCKSSSLAFVLLFAFIFRLERPSWSLMSVILIISFGVMLMVANEVDFVWIGFLQVMLASVMGGLRWSLTQILLSPPPSSSSSSGNHHQKQHPITSVLHLSPIMALCIFFASILVEYDIFSSHFFLSFLSSFTIFIWMIVGGLVAFAMVVSEFEVIRRVGVVTLSVAGIFKEVITILVSTWFFGDSLHALNIIGLIITLIGIGMYNWLKMRAVGEQDKEKAFGLRELHGQDGDEAEEEIYFTQAQQFTLVDEDEEEEEEEEEETWKMRDPSPSPSPEDEDAK
ncbi:MAG: triose phosphate transporter [Piptocephalis tieghemiana]|nr:MAG: triose phosphate transporter [Piptocephalis tieghemiana]